MYMVNFKMNHFHNELLVLPVAVCVKVCGKNRQVRRKINGGFYEEVCSDCIAVAIASMN